MASLVDDLAAQLTSLTGTDFTVLRPHRFGYQIRAERGEYVFTSAIMNIQVCKATLALIYDLANLGFVQVGRAG